MEKNPNLPQRVFRRDGDPNSTQFSPKNSTLQRSDLQVPDLLKLDEKETRSSSGPETLESR